MSLKPEINDLKELEQRVYDKVKAINDALTKEIGESPLDGVKVMEGGILCATVSSKAVFSSPGMILEPSYYIPGCQAKAVRERLAVCKSIQSTCNAVKQMIEEKKVKTGNTVTRLNEKTIEILKASELAEV